MEPGGGPATLGTLRSRRANDAEWLGQLSLASCDDRPEIQFAPSVREVEDSGGVFLIAREVPHRQRLVLLVLLPKLPPRSFALAKVRDPR